MSDGFEAVLVTLGQMEDEGPGLDAAGGVGNPLEAMGITGAPADLYRVYMGMVGTASPEICSCCAGDTEGDPLDLCAGCWGAIRAADRRGHPHPLSAKQQALADEDPSGGELRLTIE